MTTPVLDLDTIQLAHGSHHSPEQGHCLMEAVSMFAREPFTDHQACVSPYLREFGIRLNDRANDARRQDLKRFIPLVVGTAGDSLDERRRWLAVDHVTRVTAPKWLDRAGLGDHAEQLRGLDPITERASYDAAYPLIRAARDVAYQARRDRLEPIKAAVRKAVQERLGTAVAVADAAAVAVADAVAAVAVAAAAAVADAAAAVAVAVAAAVAVVDAERDKRYWAIREAVYAKVRAVYEERYADVLAESWADALGLYERLIDPTRES